MHNYVELFLTKTHYVMKYNQKYVEMEQKGANEQINKVSAYFTCRSFKLILSLTISNKHKVLSSGLQSKV